MAFFYASKVSIENQGTIVSVDETLQDVLADIKDFSFLQIADFPVVEIKTTFKDDQGNQKIELARPWAYASVTDEVCLAAPTAAELSELIEKIRSLIGRSEDILSENRALKLQLLGNGIYTTIDEAMAEVGNGSYFAVPSEDEDIFLELYLNDNGVAALSDKIANWQLIDTAIASGDRAEIAAIEAEDSANYALASEQAALVSEQNAATSEQNASTSASEALTSEQAASVSETNALESENKALTSEQAALTSETNAANSADAAALSEQNAATSEQNASTSASEALTSEQNASDSASAAAISEQNASDSEEAAAISETNTAASEQAASISENNALASENAAASSEQNAATSEANAAQSEQNAAASEQAAENSASAAAASESNAFDSESMAMAWADNSYGNVVENGKYSARHWAVDAQNSAADAYTSESNAAQSETSALESKNAAATSESNASNSESAALASENKAESWAEADYGIQVETGRYSAKHWATESESSASGAASSELNAAASENAAATSESNASDSASAASLSESNAQNSEDKAELWAEQDKDVEVEPDRYSAKHYSEYSKEYMDEAKLAAQSLTGGMFFGGEWDASSGSAPPTPTDGSAFYKVSTPGTINSVEYSIGDSIVYNNISNTWFKLDGSDKVDSVNGKIGIITLTTSDISEGSRLYFTTSRAINAIKGDSSWNASNWDEAFSWGDHAAVGYAIDSEISVVGKTGHWDDLIGKPTSFTPSAHTHHASDIDSGVFDSDRIPTITHGKTNFADQQLNKNSEVEHAEVRTGGATDDGVNSLQVQGGARTDTLAAGGVENAQESIDTDGNVQIRGENKLKMGGVDVQFDATSKSLTFSFV